MTSIADDRFTLQPGRWYAAELIGDEFGPRLRSYSPVRVDTVMPAGGGRRRFDLTFYHANYPEGVRNKTYTLETLERSERLLLARRVDSKPTRLLLLSEISWPWLRSHFADWLRAFDGRVTLDSEDVEHWLSGHA